MKKDEEVTIDEEVCPECGGDVYDCECADTWGSDLYSAIGGDDFDGEPVYLSDGVWLYPDGSMEDR